MAFDQLRLVVESIDVAYCARAENHQHALGLRLEMRLSRGIRFGWVDLGVQWASVNLRLASKHTVMLQKRRNRDASQTPRQQVEETASAEPRCTLI